MQQLLGIHQEWDLRKKDESAVIAKWRAPCLFLICVSCEGKRRQKGATPFPPRNPRWGFFCMGWPGGKKRAFRREQEGTGPMAAKKLSEGVNEIERGAAMTMVEFISSTLFQIFFAPK
jgi:hypothetical protein